MRLHRKGALNVFWRIYLYGFLLLFIIAVTAGIATHLGNMSGRGPKLHSSNQMIARLFAAYVEENPQGSPEFNDLLQHLHELTNVSLSVFDVNNQRIAHAGDLEVTPLELERLKMIKRPRFMLRDSHANTVIPLIISGKRVGYAMMTWRSHGHVRFVLVIAAVLLMLAIMPLLLARTITVPLRKIAGATRQIGDGNLSARTGVDRADEVGALARDVDTMAARIENLIRSEKSLLANISHEIRTPLARIRVLLELIDEAHGHCPPEQLDGLNADVAELESLLEDVFLTAKLDVMMDKGGEAGLVLKPETFNVGHFTGEVAERFRKRNPDTPLSLEIKDDSMELNADARLLRRLMMNLLDNAVKYSGDDARVELQVDRVEKGIRFRVMDNGPGIDDRELDRIFEPFFRAERESNTGQPGVGIGLTLCRRIVEAHGGTIWASNRDDGVTGAVFEVVVI